MAKFSLKLPQMDELEELDEKQSIRKIYSYLFQLNEQLKYMMSNLDDENLAEGAVNEQALGVDIRNLIRNITLEQDGLKGYISVTAAGITEHFTDLIGDFSDLSQTATSISQAVGDALGNYSTTQETATAISTYVTNALGDYSTTQQTANAISAYVANNAYTKISGINITADGIDIVGSQYARIGTNGKLIVTSGNVQIDQNGNAKIGGFSVTNGYIGASEDGVYMAKNIVTEDALGNETLTYAGGVRVMRYGTEDFVLWAGSDGRVLINGHNIADGWLESASVSGNTLILTKHDGSTVNFSKAAVSRVAIEAAATDSAFNAVAYDSSSTILGYANGEVYLDNQPANYSRSTWACVRQAGGSRAAYVPLSGYWDAAQAAAQAALIGDVDFVEQSGQVYAKVYDTNGNLLKTSTKYLTNSLDSMTFTRDTLRVIKKWDGNGTLLGSMASGSLAAYWDAAQAAV